MTNKTNMPDELYVSPNGCQTLVGSLNPPDDWTLYIRADKAPSSVDGGGDKPTKDYDEYISSQTTFNWSHLKFYADRMYDALTRSQDNAPVVGWMPIDKPPSTDETILVCWPDGARRLSMYLNGNYWFESKGKHMVNKIGFTHWMPLPEPPRYLALTEGNEDE